MAQGKADNSAALDKVLKLAKGLTAKEQEQLVEEMKLEWLKRELQQGIDEADRGELIDGDELLQELEQRAQDRLRKSQQ